MAELPDGPIIPSPLVDANLPALDDQLWTPSAAFVHNWQQACRVYSQYTTDVKHSPSMVSSREGLRDRPRKLVTAELLALSTHELKTMRSFMFRQGQARSLAPLFCDQTFLTQPTGWSWVEGSSVGNGSWAYKSKVGVFDLSRGGQTIFFTPPHDLVKGMLFLCASGTTPVVNRTTPGEPNSDVDVILPAATVAIRQNQGAHNNTTGTNWHFHRGVVDFDVLGGAAIDPDSFGIPTVELNALTLDYLLARGWASGTLASVRFMYFQTSGSFIDLKVQATATISCDTSLRRFYRGGRVMVCTPPNDSAAVPRFAIGTIGTVLSGGLALEDGFVNDFPLGARVYPLMEGRPVLRPEISLETDTAGSLTYSVQEDVGVTQIPATALPGEQTTTQAAFGLPVFPCRGDWKTKPRLSSDRSETSTPSGITDVSKLKGLRPVVVCALDFEFLTRQEAWDFIRFFDSRRGRLFPFILRLPSWELVGVNYGVNDVEFRASGDERDWFFAQYVCFELADGSTHFLKVESWERYAPPNDNLDHVTFTQNLPAGVNALNVVAAYFAISACFDSDAMQEEWSTDETMRTSMAFREYPFDQDVSIPVDDPRTGVERNPDGPFPGDPGMPPPGTVVYCQLQDCNGVPVNKWVRSNPPPPPYIYDPGTGAVMIVDCTTTVVGQPPGTVVLGFEEVPFPPGDPANPPWVPPCNPASPSCFDYNWMVTNCPFTKTVTISDPYADANNPDYSFSGTHTVTLQASGSWVGYAPSPSGSGMTKRIQLACSEGSGVKKWFCDLTTSVAGFGHGASFEQASSNDCPADGGYGFVSESGSISMPKSGASVSVS
jgi:hypothetical protein